MLNTSRWWIIPYPQNFGGKVFTIIVVKRRLMNFCLNSSLILKCLLFNHQSIIKSAFLGTRNSWIPLQADGKSTEPPFLLKWEGSSSDYAVLLLYSIVSGRDFASLFVLSLPPAPLPSWCLYFNIMLKEMDNCCLFWLFEAEKKRVVEAKEDKTDSYGFRSAVDLTKPNSPVETQTPS